jgi:hypothetical protein
MSDEDRDTAWETLVPQLVRDTTPRRPKKPPEQLMQQITLGLPPKILALIDKERKELTRSVWIRGILVRYLRGEFGSLPKSGLNIDYRRLLRGL